jgi:hypothetical protein
VRFAAERPALYALLTTPAAPGQPGAERKALWNRLLAVVGALTGDVDDTDAPSRRGPSCTATPRSAPRGSTARAGRAAGSPAASRRSPAASPGTPGAWPRSARRAAPPARPRGTGTRATDRAARPPARHPHRLARDRVYRKHLPTLHVGGGELRKRYLVAATGRRSHFVHPP